MQEIIATTFEKYSDIEITFRKPKFHQLLEPTKAFLLEISDFLYRYIEFAQFETKFEQMSSASLYFFTGYKKCEIHCFSTSRKRK